MTEGAMKYYLFQQNNSGGSFDVDENLDTHVYIQAESIEEARAKGLALGMYEDPDYDRDCKCCGQRWYLDSVRCEDGVNLEELYATVKTDLGYWPERYAARIHHADGRVESLT